MHNYLLFNLVFVLLLRWDSRHYNSEQFFSFSGSYNAYPDCITLPYRRFSIFLTYSYGETNSYSLGPFARQSEQPACTLVTTSLTYDSTQQALYIIDQEASPSVIHPLLSTVV